MCSTEHKGQLPHMIPVLVQLRACQECDRILCTLLDEGSSQETRYHLGQSSPSWACLPNMSLNMYSLHELYTTTTVYIIYKVCNWEIPTVPPKPMTSATKEVKGSVGPALTAGSLPGHTRPWLEVCCWSFIVPGSERRTPNPALWQHFHQEQCTGLERQITNIFTWTVGERQ